jgi:methylenetetrahydrofolate dehydrogenase (NADP+)/methenyltetrahydrofolate cyclohydrolase
MIIKGRPIADRIIQDLKTKLTAHPIEKFMGAILVGGNPASINFLKQKEKVAKELGVDFRLYKLPEDITTDTLREEVGRLSRVKNCGGFIVQLPLPKHVNAQYIVNAVPKEKDVDLLGEAALGAFYSERHSIVPPAVGATIELLHAVSLQNLREVNVVLMGAGFLIGRPIGLYLQNKVKQLAILDSKVKDPNPWLKEADLVVSGVGKANLFSATQLKPGAIVFDFGCEEVGGKIVGDFDAEPLKAESYNLEAISYTPTPGGTGPILVAKLYQNFYLLNRQP